MPGYDDVINVMDKTDKALGKAQKIKKGVGGLLPEEPKEEEQSK